MKTYLTFNTNARLFGWINQHRRRCIQITGEDPVHCFARPIANRDLGPMTYNHADFPPKIQWWLKKHCPYPFVRTGEAKSTILMRIKDRKHGKAAR